MSADQHDLSGLRLLAAKFEADPKVIESKDTRSEAKTFETFYGTQGEFTPHEIFLDGPAAVFSPISVSWRR